MLTLPTTAIATERRALRINEYCARYGVSRSTTYKMIGRGQLRLHKIGGRSLIKVEDAEALLNGVEGMANQPPTKSASEATSA
jgi:excisionase family DNA binding protein